MFMNFATEVEYSSSIKWYIYKGNVFSRSHHKEVTAALAFIAETEAFWNPERKGKYEHCILH